MKDRYRLEAHIAMGYGEPFPFANLPCFSGFQT
jgi:hypothetical protein